MAKVNFTDLPLGHPLTPGMVWDNLDQVATALSGNISADQRSENRSYFSVCFNKVRLGMGQNRTTPPDKDSSGTFDYTTEKRPAEFWFKVPPLQEHFSSNLDTDLSTPSVIFESLAISFDNLNQQYPTDINTGLPDASVPFTQELKVLISTGSGSLRTEISMPVSGMTSLNNEIIQKPNPTINAFIGAAVDPYAEITIEIQSPVPQTTKGAASERWGVDSFVVHGVFSHPIVERDSEAVAGEIIQNAPLHNLARDTVTNTLTRPLAGSLIEATNATLTGVQDAFEQLDTQVRGKLSGGLTRWSEITPGGESIKDDQGYFCIMVPMFNVPENDSLQQWLAPATDTLAGYIRPYSKIGGVSSLMDLARVPILAPGSIHHVGVFWDRVRSTANPVSAAGLYEVRMDFGLALGCSTRARSANYTQVCLVEDKNINFEALTNNIRGFFAPIVYSTHATAPSLGKGFVTQGRPFYFGKEIDYTGLAKRRNAATTTPANAEVAPPTDGTEQFFELRCNLSLYDTAAAGYTAINGQPGYFGNGSGIVVCIYGKMALVD